jgi:type II secretory pathway pseudopilin PulG
MRLAQRYRSVRSFTLLEILVVLTILVVLSSLTWGAIRRAIVRAERGRAEAQLETLKAALTMYEADLRMLPLSQQGTTPATLFRDHAPYLYAALQNDPSAALGGGTNAPYVRGSDIGVGAITDRAVLEPEPMGKDGQPRVRTLASAERARVFLKEFQSAHAPEGPEPLVFLDPWGSPWHCRVWKNVQSALKDKLVKNPVDRTGFAENPVSGGNPPVAGPVPDHPHDPVGVDIWSNGPNGVNEYGAGDDVRSW